MLGPSFFCRSQCSLPCAKVAFENRRKTSTPRPPRRSSPTIHRRRLRPPAIRQRFRPRRISSPRLQNRKKWIATQVMRRRETASTGADLPTSKRSRRFLPRSLGPSRRRKQLAKPPKSTRFLLPLTRGPTSLNHDFDRSKSGRCLRRHRGRPRTPSRVIGAASPGLRITIDAAESGKNLNFRWHQVRGHRITANRMDQPTLTFTVPGDAKELAFLLVVYGPNGSDSTVVDIPFLLLRPKVAPAAGLRRRRGRSDRVRRARNHPEWSAKLTAPKRGVPMDPGRRAAVSFLPPR